MRCRKTRNCELTSAKKKETRSDLFYQLLLKVKLTQEDRINHFIWIWRSAVMYAKALKWIGGDERQMKRTEQRMEDEKIEMRYADVYRSPALKVSEK
jgi:hypothetical protein